MRSVNCRTSRARRFGCAGIIVASTVLVTAAQVPSDLSGRWVLEAGQKAASDTPRAVSVRQSLVRTMERGPMKPFFRDLIIEREFETGTRTETFQIGAAGETVPVFDTNKPTDPHSTGRSVHWHGNALVIEGGSEPANTANATPPEQRETWSIEPDGRLKLSLTMRTSGETSRTDSFMYRRQAPAGTRRIP
jgi:hypothetical protein